MNHLKMPHNKKILMLEVIRGLAAVEVLLFHVVGKIPTLSENFILNSVSVWGIEAVIVFFILSGVTIRVSTEGKQISTKKFLYKRFIRIVPLYLLAAITALLIDQLILNKPPSISVIVGNLLFLSTLQGYIANVTASNNVLWTLSYEMSFYLIFAFTLNILHERLVTGWLIFSLVALSATPFVTEIPAPAQQFVSILSYSSIWLLGYYTVSFAKKLIVPIPFAIFIFSLIPLVARTPFYGGYLDPVKHLIIGIACMPLFICVLNKTFDPHIKIRKMQWIIFAILVYCLIVFLHLNFGFEHLQNLDVETQLNNKQE